MIEYPKIETIWNRDEHFKVIVGSYKTPEFGYLKHAYWRASEKINGTNIRIDYRDGQFTTGGRTPDSQIPIFLLSKL